MELPVTKRQQTYATAGLRPRCEREVNASTVDAECTGLTQNAESQR